MEAIVRKVLKKYFKLFILNFKKEQLDVELFKGVASLQALQLNTKVLAELIYLPPTFEIQSASCNSLVVDVPWTKLSSKAITITIDKIDIALAEPIEVAALTDYLSAIRKKKKSSSAPKDILLNASVEINEINITVSTHPVSHKPNWNPKLYMIWKSIKIKSCNGKWEVADLSQCKEESKETEITKIFKRIDCNSISIYLEDENAGKIHLFKEQPLSVFLTSKWKFKEALWMGADVDVTYDEFSLDVNVDQWNSILDFVRCIRQCLSRPIPSSSSSSTATTTSTSSEVENAPLSSSSSSSSSENLNNSKTNKPQYRPEININVLLNHWFMKLIDKREGKRNGYIFEGKGFSILISQIREEERAGKIQFRLPSVQLTNVNLKSHLLTTSSSDLDAFPINDKLNSKDLISLTLESRIKYADDKYQCTEYSLYGHLRGLHTLFHLPTWRHLWEILFPPNPSLLNTSSDNEEEQQQESSEGINTTTFNKHIKEQLQKTLKGRLTSIQDFNDLKLQLEINNIIFDICAETPEPCYQLHVGRLAITNNPSWTSLPVNSHEQHANVASESVVLPQNKIAVDSSGNIKVTTVLSKMISRNSIYKIESDLENFTITSCKGESSQKFSMQSDRANIYFRYHQESDKNDPKIALHFPELAWVIGKLKFQIKNTDQLSDFLGVVKYFRSYFESMYDVKKLDQWKSKMKETISSKVDQQIKGQIESAQQSEAPLLENISNKVKKSLARIKVVVIFQCKEAVIVIPLKTKTSLPTSNVTSSVKESTMRLEQFEFSTQNYSDKTSVYLRLKKLEANQFKPSKSRYFITIIPSYLLDASPTKIFNIKTDNIWNLELQYSKTKSKSEAVVKLRNLFINLLPKNSSNAKKFKIPNIENLLASFTKFVDTNKQKISSNLEKVKDKGISLNNLTRENASINVSTPNWNMECSDVTMNMLDPQDSSIKGSMKLGSSQVTDMVDKFLELEGQLIHTKLNLAQNMSINMSEIDELLKKNKEYEDKLAKSQSLCDDLEKKFVALKLSMAQIQMEKEDAIRERDQLKVELKRKKN